MIELVLEEVAERSLCVSITFIVLDEPHEQVLGAGAGSSAHTRLGKINVVTSA